MAASTGQDTSCYTSVKYTYKTDPSAGEIPAYIYYDADSKSPTHPIAILYHAGGFVLGSTGMIPRNQIDYLIKLGFIVVLPEYRLAPQVSIAAGPVADALDAYTWTQTALPSLFNKSTSQTIDPAPVIAIGYSAGAFLALSTASLASPPKAIIDFYGVKYLSDKSYRRPLPMFAAIPDLAPDFLDKIYEGAVPFTSGPFMINGKPALSDPRTAWMLNAFKKGTFVTDLIPDGDYSFDVSESFGRTGRAFPPTMFVHGRYDPFIDVSVSIRAHEALKSQGCDSELVIAEEKSVGHVFDMSLAETDELWQTYVKPALDFAGKHV